jgi:hypothetical protein
MYGFNIRGLRDENIQEDHGVDHFALGTRGLVSDVLGNPPEIG